jgi:MarR family transcriptional regulator, organic hydroperoxide resistance regulator
MSTAPAAAHGPTPGFLVWRLSMKWRVAMDRALAPLGLTHAQFSQLGSLLDLEGSGKRPTQKELADHTGLEPLYVSKLARTLEAAGLIVRTEHPDDSRAVQLSLTTKGRDVTTQATVIVRSLVNELLGPLGGLDGEGTAAFVAALHELLEMPT